MTAKGMQEFSTFIATGDVTSGSFREMMDALPAAVYTTDAEGRLTYFNPAATRLSGHTPELGTDNWCVTWNLFQPDGTPLPHDQCPMALALKGMAIPAGVECVAERPDGSRFWFTPYPAALRDSEGRIIGSINVLVDITGRKTAEIEANEQARAIIETTPECVKIVARDGTLLFMNAPGLDMVGAVSADDVTGKSIYDMVAPEDRQRFREFNERVCAGDKASLEFDIVGLKGVRRHMETHAAPLRHTDGSTVQLAITRDITQRACSERASELLGAIVDSSDDAIISKDLNGVITSWNKGAERLFGYNAGEAIGKSVVELLIPDDRQEEEPEILARLRRGERVDHFETVRRRRDGSLVDISLTISPVKDSHGRIIGASKIARDISERKRAYEAIRNLNAQLTTDLAAMTRIHELSTRMMQVEDFPKLMEDIVAAAIEITGAQMGNIQLLEDGGFRIVAQRGFQAAFLDFFDNVKGTLAACGAALESRERAIIEDIERSPVFEGQRMLDIMRQAEVRAVQSTPLMTRSREIVGVLSTHWQRPWRPSERDLRLIDILARQTADLVERRRAETALLASEARFKQLADAMPQIVWTARPDGVVDYFNERWYHFTGHRRDMFDWQPVLEPSDLPRMLDAWAASVQSGEPFNIELRLWDRCEKRWRWFVSRALAVRRADGHIIKWFGTSTDIDEQKRAQADLERANADLEQFAFSASHDLQEPLRSIKIYSELLVREYGEHLPADAERYIRFLQAGATRMENLVRDLLAYTRVTKFEAPTESADANDALQAALTDLASAVSEAGAHVAAEQLPASVPVHRTHLQQLFQNLVGNAVKYRSPQRVPEVRIGAEQDNGHWTFSVADNGIGIEPEYKEKIFGLFKRLHTSDEYSGTGIGLAICKRIVGRYNGRIWVESKPGAGSTFRFTLPV
jgi:PAS domain S-box-containing protein